MVPPKFGITLELTPKSRLDVIDVKREICRQFGDFLDRHPKTLYYSYHTTAGYLDPGLCARFNHDRDSLQSFIASFQELFPPDAGYQHDQLHLRSELSDQQRQCEPRNADSHLTFMGAGLTNCVTYPSDPQVPVYFVDLDGVCGKTRRKRHTTVIPFTRETPVGELTLEVPVGTHPVSSVNLKDPRLGLFQQLQELAADCGIEKGRIDVRLPADELHAALTVNEFETLLMKHDVAEVLWNPFKFMAEKGRHILEDPGSIPVKARDYAKYDLVRLVNQFVDALGLSESLFERIVQKCLAVPAARFLRMKRSVSLMVVRRNGEIRGSIVEGTYQSPILIQWKKPESRSRKLLVQFVRFE